MKIRKSKVRFHCESRKMLHTLVGAKRPCLISSPYVCLVVRLSPDSASGHFLFTATVECTFFLRTPFIYFIRTEFLFLLKTAAAPTLSFPSFLNGEVGFSI